MWGGNERRRRELQRTDQRRMRSSGSAASSARTGGIGGGGERRFGSVPRNKDACVPRRESGLVERKGMGLEQREKKTRGAGVGEDGEGERGSPTPFASRSGRPADGSPREAACRLARARPDAVRTEGSTTKKREGLADRRGAVDPAVCNFGRTLISTAPRPFVLGSKAGMIARLWTCHGSAGTREPCRIRVRPEQRPWRPA